MLTDMSISTAGHFVEDADVLHVIPTAGPDGPIAEEDTEA